MTRFIQLFDFDYEHSRALWFYLSASILISILLEPDQPNGHKSQYRMPSWWTASVKMPHVSSRFVAQRKSENCVLCKTEQNRRTYAFRICMSVSIISHIVVQSLWASVEALGYCFLVFGYNDCFWFYLLTVLCVMMSEGRYFLQKMHLTFTNFLNQATIKHKWDLKARIDELVENINAFCFIYRE